MKCEPQYLLVLSPIRIARILSARSIIHGLLRILRWEPGAACAQKTGQSQYLSSVTSIAPRNCKTCLYKSCSHLTGLSELEVECVMQQTKFITSCRNLSNIQLMLLAASAKQASVNVNYKSMAKTRALGTWIVVMSPLVTMMVPLIASVTFPMPSLLILLLIRLRTDRLYVHT